VSARVSLGEWVEALDSSEELDLLRREALKVFEKPLPRRARADGGGDGAFRVGTAPVPVGDWTPRLG
jgi:hypothetical protein